MSDYRHPKSAKRLFTSLLLPGLLQSATVSKSAVGTAIWIALGVVLFSAPASAQVLYGSVVGTVTDPSGAFVHGASVTLTSNVTGEKWHATTNEVGYYNFPVLSSGSYSLTVDFSGFSRYVRQDLPVLINQLLRVDVPLKVGAVSEQLVVNAASPILQTDRADVHTDFRPAELANLPLPPGRNFEQMVVTVPGFTPPGQTNSIAANPSRAVTFNVNGGSRFGNTIRIDGAGINSVYLSYLMIYVPSIEAIDTVNVVTNSYDAEQGLAGAAAINVIMKSGTNDLHGSAFEFNNNNGTKARPYFLPSGQGKPKYILNEFGATIGGPIVRNKLFYFVSYESTLHRETGATFTTVPTAAIRAGDESASPRVIYDPSTGNPDGSGRIPFAGNIIAPSLHSPIVKKLIDLTPMPNIPDLLTNNFYGVGAYKFNRHTFDTKLNYSSSSKLTVYGRVGLLKVASNNPPVFGRLGGAGVQTSSGTTNTVTGKTYTTSVGATYIVTPTFLIDGNFGLSVLDTIGQPIGLNEKLGLDYLGIPGTNGPGVNGGGWPNFSITNYTAIGVPWSNWPLIYYDPSVKHSMNANWTRGTHNVRFGYEMASRYMNHWEGSEAGAFSFDGSVTTIKGGASPNQFNSYGEFLLGLPSSVSRTHLPEQMSAHERLGGLYVRDQWQVSRRLTFSYGLRWEYYSMPARRTRGMETYDVSTNKMLICGVGAVPKDCGMKVSKRLFVPRFGLTYRVTDSFVIRAGYGITYDPYCLARAMLTNYPTSVSLSMPRDNSYVPVGTLAQGIPKIVDPDFGNGIIDVPTQYSVPVLPNFFRRGYIQSWNFSLQKQLRENLTGEVAYVGTRQVRQFGTLNLNAGTLGGGQGSQPFFKAYGRTASVSIITPRGNTHYDALQARLHRRFSEGLQLQANYTWSKSMGVCCDSDSGGSPAILLPEYSRLNYAVSSIDRTHTFTFTGVYELPFGKGKKFVNHTGLSSKLFGGWQVNALLVAYTGLPFSVSSSATSLNTPGSSQRADQVKPSVQKLGGIGATTAYYDPLAFAPVTTVTFGTAGFNSLRGPGYVNLDAGIFRAFAIREGWQIQLRAEALNFTNTPHFGNPASNVSNLQLNPDGSIRSLGGFMTITTISPVAASREGIDERLIRFGLHLRF